MVDNHSLSFKYDSDPNGASPKDEIELAKKELKKWYKAFPSLFLCLGNHDKRADLKGRHVGLPDCVFRPFRDIWELPKGWIDRFSFEIDGVIYQHGKGYSGENAHMKAAYNNRQSTVIGHTHSFLGGGYIANEKDKIFGVNCGCGIDRHAYAFGYGADMRKKPLLGCAVITDKGRYWQTFPMEL